MALLAGVALFLIVAGNAGAAKLVGKDGKVYACYTTKGKAKGAVRLVAKKQHCKHGEKKISWNVAGKPGQSGQNGENGAGGGNGEAGGPGAAGLEGRVTALTNKVSSLEGILKGITNTDLTGLLSKLQGVSGAQLQEAVASIANVKALCTQAKVLTTQANTLGTALMGVSLTGATGPVLSLLGLSIPSVPALPSFTAC
jgi:hypothetical protein